MAFGLFNELLPLVNGNYVGEVDPYYQVYADLPGNAGATVRTLVAHVVPRAKSQTLNRELWIITYEEYPWNGITPGSKTNLEFVGKSTPSADPPALDALLKEKDPAYVPSDAKTMPRYTHVAYPLLDHFVVHDGLK